MYNGFTMANRTVSQKVLAKALDDIRDAGAMYGNNYGVPAGNGREAIELLIADGYEYLAKALKILDDAGRDRAVFTQFWLGYGDSQR